MSNTITGTVESMSRDGHSLKVDGVWYTNKFQKLPDSVEYKGSVVLTLKEGTTFWKSANGGGGNSGDAGNSNGSSSTGSNAMNSNKIGAVALERDRCIVRQNALTNACNVLTVGGDIPSAESVIELAMAFEEYTSGDIDKKIIDNMENS